MIHLFGLYFSIHILTELGDTFHPWLYRCILLTRAETEMISIFAGGSIILLASAMHAAAAACDSFDRF